MIKALRAEGATLSQLGRANLTFDASQALVIFDGREFRAGRGLWWIGNGLLSLMTKATTREMERNSGFLPRP